MKSESLSPGAATAPSAEPAAATDTPPLIWLIDGECRLVEDSQKIPRHARDLLSIVNGMLLPVAPGGASQWRRDVAMVASRGHRALAALRSSTYIRHALLDGSRVKGSVRVTLEPRRFCPEPTLLAYAACHGLTNAEIRTLSLLTDGTSPRQIAQTLDRSEATIRSHIRNLLAKTQEGSINALMIRLARIVLTMQRRGSDA